MNGDDAAGVRQFAGALAAKVNQALGSELDGSFSVIKYPKGFPYFWQYGPNNYYNKATLDLVDKCASIDGNGVCAFTGESFSSLYLQMLTNVEFIPSDSDEAKISEAVVTVGKKVTAVVTAYEGDMGAITEAQIKSSGVFPLTKIEYIVQQVKARWGGPSKIPDSLVELQTAYKQWYGACQTLKGLQSSQTSSQEMLAKARLHTSNPSADNGGLPLSRTEYHVPFLGFRPTNAITGSLDTASNSLTVSWEVSNLSSPGRSTSIVDGAATGPASFDVVMVNFSRTDQQALSLRNVSGSASKAESSITYPGLTIIQSEPMPLKADLTVGWYETEILTQVVQKDGTADTGFRLTGSQYSIRDLFGPGKRFARVKTFVVSREPTIKITFYDAKLSALLDKYQPGKSISLSLAGTFHFGLGGSGLEVQSVDSHATGENKTVVTIGPAITQGSILDEDRTAHILGGVVDYPPVILTRPEPGSISVKNSGGFMASFSIQYKQGGEIRNEESGEFSLWVRKILPLPADAAEILLTVQIAIFIKTWSVVATRRFDKPVTKSFELTGTTSNPVCKEV